MAGNGYLNNLVIGFLACVLACIFIAGWLNTPVATSDGLLVSEDACGAVDYDTLVVALEFAGWADQEMVVFLVSYGYETGELLHFPAGTIVYPTGLTRRWSGLRIIEVTTSLSPGRWWIPAMQTVAI